MSKPIKQQNGVEWYADGTILLMRCPKCHRENWAPAVATGQCVWCGYRAEPITDKTDKK